MTKRHWPSSPGFPSPGKGPGPGLWPEPPAGLHPALHSPHSDRSSPSPQRTKSLCVELLGPGPHPALGCSRSLTLGRSIHLPALLWLDLCLAGELTLKPPTSLQTTSSCQVLAPLIPQTVNHQLRGHSHQTEHGQLVFQGAGFHPVIWVKDGSSHLEARTSIENLLML